MCLCVNEHFKLAGHNYPSGLRFLSAGSCAAKQPERMSAIAFRWSGRTIGIEPFIK
jgi:hypothetical protein